MVAEAELDPGERRAQSSHRREDDQLGGLVLVQEAARILVEIPGVLEVFLSLLSVSCGLVQQAPQQPNAGKVFLRETLEHVRALFQRRFRVSELEGAR